MRTPICIRLRIMTDDRTWKSRASGPAVKTSEASSAYTFSKLSIAFSEIDLKAVEGDTQDLQFFFRLNTNNLYTLPPKKKFEGHRKQSGSKLPCGLSPLLNNACFDLRTPLRVKYGFYNHLNDKQRKSFYFMRKEAS